MKIAINTYSFRKEIEKTHEMTLEDVFRVAKNLKIVEGIELLDRHIPGWPDGDLSKGIAEPSFFVEGIHKYKYRPDVVTDKYIFDYKRIDKRRWSKKGIHYQINDFGYDISAAMYQYFEWIRTGAWKPFVIIWIMTDPPFDILMQNMGKYAYEVFGENEVIANSGAIIFEALKNQHELCQASQKWPGLSAQFDRVGGVRIADFPPIYENYFEDFEVETNR